MNYDPNIGYCTHVVELRLAQWEYRATKLVRIHGNIKGSEVLRAAVESLYDQLEEVDGVKRVTLKYRNDILHCEYDGDSDWPADFVISAKIIQVLPEEVKHTEPERSAR